MVEEGGELLLCMKSRQSCGRLGFDNDESTIEVASCIWDEVPDFARRAVFSLLPIFTCSFALRIELENDEPEISSASRFGSRARERGGQFEGD